MAEPKIPEFLSDKEKAKDFGLQTLQGIGTGLRNLCDTLGAQNPLSKKIQGYEDYLAGLLSAESKKNQKEVQTLLQKAEKEGHLANVLAGLQAFATAPEALAASTLGQALPHLAGGIWAKAAGLGKAGILGVQAGLGSLQGAGSTKSQIYSAVANELLQSNLPPDKIEKAAQEAQAYDGKNLDQILLSAGLGIAAATTGTEKILTNILTKQGIPATKNLLKSILKGGLSEAPLEGLQAGQQKIAENTALQKEGAQIPTLQGVAAQATLEATTGLIIGSGAGGIQTTIQTPKNTKKETTAQEDIDELSYDDLEYARFANSLPHLNPETLRANLLTPTPWAQDPTLSPTFGHELAQLGELDKLPPGTLSPEAVGARPEGKPSIAMLATKTNQTHLVAPHLTANQLLEQDAQGNTITHFAILQDCLNLLPPTSLTKTALGTTNNEGNTPTHTLFATKKIGTVDQNLLFDQTNLSKKNKDGDTPTLLGAESGCLDLLQPKFFTRENLSQTNNNQENCLHKALESQNFNRFPWRRVEPELLRELLNQPNKNQTTPLELARNHQKENQIPDQTLETLQNLAQSPTKSQKNQPQPLNPPKNKKAPKLTANAELSI